MVLVVNVLYEKNKTVKLLFFTINLSLRQEEKKVHNEIKSDYVIKFTQFFEKKHA